VVDEFKASRFGPLCLLGLGLLIAFFAVVALAQGYTIPGLVLVAVSAPFDILGVRMLASGGTLVFDAAGIDDRGRGFRLPWGSVADLELRTETVNTVSVPGIAVSGSIPWLVATLEPGTPRPQGAPRAGTKDDAIAYSLKPFFEDPEEIVDRARSHWQGARGGEP
jgi:hypothetical protein